MEKYAIVVLTDTVKTRLFEFKDDFDTARQTLITKGVDVIPLKWHHGAKRWVKPETYA